jgi:hypothetical protein
MAASPRATKPPPRSIVVAISRDFDFAGSLSLVMLSIPLT